MNHGNARSSHEYMCVGLCSEERVSGSHGVFTQDSGAKEIEDQAWLVRLSGLRAGMLTKRLQVQFPVRSHA